MSARFSTPLLEIVNSQSDSDDKISHKRPRAKYVTWAAPDRIHQVRLFAAEDAPASLGSVSQDLLEAKQVKILHSQTAIDQGPLGADAKHGKLNSSCVPGGDNLVTKRAKLDITPTLAMDVHLHWRCPEKFLYNPSWQIAAGEDSSDLTVQQHREVRALETFYPRVSTIPDSPLEPPSIKSESDDFQPLEIPLISCDEEEDTSLVQGYNDPISSNASSEGVSFVSEIAPRITSDPDVAAAAAAAFAVIKAQERGSLIDRDLLIKILSNPLLTEILKKSISSSSSLFPDKPDSQASDNATMTSRSNLQASNQERSHLSLEEKVTLQRQQQGVPTCQPLGFNASKIFYPPTVWGPHATPGNFDQEKGILGDGKNVYGFSSAVNNLWHDPLKKVFVPSHARGVPAIHEGRARGTLSHTLSESTLGTFPRKGSREKTGNAAKVRRTCLFFNTPKGCRNGVHCSFLHEVAQTEPCTERANPNPPELAEVKVSKGEMDLS